MRQLEGFNQENPMLLWLQGGDWAGGAKSEERKWGAPFRPLQWPRVKRVSSHPEVDEIGVRMDKHGSGTEVKKEGPVQLGHWGHGHWQGRIRSLVWGEFPGCPVIRTQHFSLQWTRFNPWSGN